MGDDAGGGSLDEAGEPRPDGGDRDGPRVSIIVPVYNGARHLGPFFEGIEAQFRPDMELVLVDDGSTDETAAIIGTFAATSRWRVQVVTLEQNQGLGAARRAGFQAGVGAHVMCLDVDDVLRAGALDAVVSAVETEPANTVVVFDYGVVVGGRTRVEAGMDADLLQAPGESVAAILRAEMSPFMWNKVFPREGLSTDDLVLARLGEDVPTLIRVLQVHPRARRVRSVLLDYVVGADTLSQTGDLVAYTSPEGGHVAEVYRLISASGVVGDQGRCWERWFAPRVLAAAAVAAARRRDGCFADVRRNVMHQTTMGQALSGVVGGDRGWSAMLVLLRLAPPVFSLVSRLTAPRSLSG